MPSSVLLNQAGLPNTACTDEVGSQEGAKANRGFGGVEEHKTAACRSACKAL
jgi:hypothetical protein